MDSYKTGLDNCPHCGHDLDVATNPVEGERAPKQGDMTMCTKCAGICRFGPGMKLEVFPEEDLAKLPEEVLEKVLVYQSALVSSIIKSKSDEL